MVEGGWKERHTIGRGQAERPNVTLNSHIATSAGPTLAPNVGSSVVHLQTLCHCIHFHHSSLRHLCHTALHLSGKFSTTDEAAVIMS